jgi:hypothetical protein
MGGHDSKAAFAAAIATLKSALGRLRDGHSPTDQSQLEEISDVPYDRSMWAEDEGFGAPDRHAP